MILAVSVGPHTRESNPLLQARNHLDTGRPVSLKALSKVRSESEMLETRNRQVRISLPASLVQPNAC
jgi:hypothetical protein